jgi:hypothetical protein
VLRLKSTIVFPWERQWGRSTRAPIGLKWAKTKGKLAMGASALGREHDHM